MNIKICTECATIFDPYTTYTGKPISKTHTPRKWCSKNCKLSLKKDYHRQWRMRRKQKLLNIRTKV